MSIGFFLKKDLPYATFATKHEINTSNVDIVTMLYLIWSSVFKMPVSIFIDNDESKSDTNNAPNNTTTVSITTIKSILCCFIPWIIFNANSVFLDEKLRLQIIIPDRMADMISII